VILQRRSNGQLLAEAGSVTPEQLERRHLTAMGMDFVRGGVVAFTGALTGYGLMVLALPVWSLPPIMTLRVLGVVAAGLVGTALPLFGGWTPRRRAFLAGLGLGLVLTSIV